jgi:protein arginine N-methyltransferase 7
VSLAIPLATLPCLQYLDRAVRVEAGRKVAVLVRREEGRLKFGLRQGVGEYVPRAPWKVEWGGGASVENPHFQRVHYCQLLVSPRHARVAVRVLCTS